VTLTFNPVYPRLDGMTDSAGSFGLLISQGAYLEGRLCPDLPASPGGPQAAFSVSRLDNDDTRPGVIRIHASLFFDVRRSGCNAQTLRRSRSLQIARLSYNLRG